MQHLIHNCRISITRRAVCDTYGAYAFRPETWQMPHAYRREELIEQENSLSLPAFFEQIAQRGIPVRRRFRPDSQGRVQCDWELNIAQAIQNALQSYDTVADQPTVIIEDLMPSLKHVSGQVLFFLHYTVLYIPETWE